MQTNNRTPIILGTTVILIAVLVVVLQSTAKPKVPPGETNQVTDNIVSTSTIAGDNISQYTMTDVAGHNSQTSCWAVVNGNVYDLTSWIGKHPGGDKAILSLCGKDGTSAFEGKHGGQENPAKVLAGFKIGSLIQPQ